MSASPEELRASVPEFWDPDADFYPVRKFPDSQPCHGLDEISQFMGRFRETWFNYVTVVNEAIAVDDERVLVHATLQGEGRESGVKLEGDLYQCCWLRHGRFLRVEHHLTLKGALHGLGLQGETLEAAGLQAPTNLDLVRSIYAAWERGDWSPIGWAHPEIEVVWADGPMPGKAMGVQGMAERTRDFLSAWEGLRTEAEEFRELDAERVLVLDRPSGGRGKTSGLEIAQMSPKGAHLFHVRGGKVARLVVYLERERALADLGLSSEASSPRS